MAETSRPSRSFRPPTGVVAAAVFVVAVIALVVLLDGDAADRGVLLGDYDPAAVEAAVEEALSPVRLRPSRELRVTGRRIRWIDAAGRPFLEAPSVSMTVRAGAAPDGGILLSAGVIQRPRLHLVQTAEDRWNYEVPLASFIGDEAGPSDGDAALGLRLRDFTVQDGYVLLDMLDARYEARSLDVRLSSATLSGPGVDGPVFRVAGAEGVLVLPDTADGTVTRDMTLADAEFRLLEGAVAFDVDAATFGSSRFAALEGLWNPDLGGLGLDMRLTAVAARIADIPWLRGEVPQGATGAFELRVEPRPGDRTALTLTRLDLRAPGSAATGSLRAVIGGARPILEAVDLRVDPLSLDLVEAFTGPLPYAGTVTGTVRGTGDAIRFDLLGRLTTPTVTDPFTTNLTGTVALTEAGFTLGDAAVTLDRLPLAALDALAPGLPLAGNISGTVQLTGTPGESPLDLDLRLEAGGGIMALRGTADLTGPVPTYDLNGELVGVRLRSILEPAAPPVNVHADFTLVGRGTDPRTATATATVHGTFTGWESEPGDTVALRARVADGAVDVEDLRLDVGPIGLAAAGRWDYVDGAGAIRYDLVVAELGPLAPYLPEGPEGQPRFARGSLRLTGTAAGTLESPALAGEARAEQFRWGEWAAESFTGDYDVRLTPGLPRIETELAGVEIRTPFGAFDALEARIDFGRPAFEVAIRADREGGRGILAIEADGIIDETGRREVFLRSMEVDLQRQRWRLPEPARIAWTAGEAVRIDALELLQTGGDGRIALEGIVAPVSDMDLSFDVARVPVGDVLDLLGSELDLAGELSLVGTVAGPAEDPDLDVALTLSDGRFRGVAIRAVETQIDYESAQLLVDGEGLLGDSARIRIEGTVPARLQLGGTPLFALVDDAPIDLQIVTRTFPLSTLDPGLASAEDLQGRLEANLRVGGTPAEPRLSGSAQLLEGAVTIPLLGRRFESIEGAVVLSGREARIRRVAVVSGGTAVLTGTVSFQQLTNPTLNLETSLDRFRFQDVENETAAGISGTLRVEGPMGRPVMTGSLRADDGAISLVPLQQPELSARLAGGLETLPELDTDFEIGTPVEEGGLEVRGLTLAAGDDLWFVTEEARLRLGGTLTVDRSGDATVIQGTLQGEGGSFELNAGLINRRFDIVSSEIRFLGSPEPNPRIDIVASRLVRVPDGANVDVRVQVGGSLQDPTLSLATATGADVPESELLSFLMFGRPTSDLGQVTGGEGVAGVLGQGLAYTGLAEALFSELTEEVAFLDYFRVDFVPGAGLFATAGVEISNDLFLDADFPLGSEYSVAAVGLEYQAGIGTFRGGYEPVQRLDRFVGTRALSILQAEIRRQFTLSWRRRWTY